MSLQAGGAPAILQRDLGTPAAIQGAQAFGSAIYGPQLASPLSGAVLMLAQDGAANFPLTAAGITGSASITLGALTVAGAGTVSGGAITGAANITLGALTLAAAGTLGLSPVEPPAARLPRGSGGYAMPIPLEVVDPYEGIRLQDDRDLVDVINILMAVGVFHGQPH